VGPATRRAILVFQKDRGLAEDGRLTQALVKLLNSLVAQLPKVITTDHCNRRQHPAVW